MSEMPFGFTWCYQETEDDDQQCLVLVIGEPEDVPPLDIEISNILSDKTIAIHPMDGVSQPDGDNYHFKLAFLPGILADPSAIAVESADWSISFVSNADGVSIYLLWTGTETWLSDQDTMKVILTGVAAQSFDKITSADVTISWEFDQGGIEVKSPAKIPEGGDYDENITLELTMVQSTGKSNIPLYVGFVNCNKVLNTYDEASSLQLRLTNTNLPSAAAPDIIFNYDADINLCSQLVVTLEVGTAEDVPWALGTRDQVNNITISMAEDQWEQNGDIETIEVEGVVQALQWTFIPQSDGVVLAARKTMLINLDNIITSHPTGEANLYLSYQYVSGYKDGQFVCQIEKAPLVFDTKVRMGTRKELDGLLNVQDGITLDGGEIQNTGLLKFRSDLGKTGENYPVVFYNQDDDDRYMRLDSNFKLEIAGLPATKDIETKEMLKLRRIAVTEVKNSNTVAFRVGAFEKGEGGRTQLDIALSGHPDDNNHYGTDADMTVMSLFADGNVKVTGRIKDKTGYVIPVGTVVPYAGKEAPEGWLMCNGESFKQSDYPELHEVLGKENLPNLQNRFITGAGDYYTLNATGGENTVLLEVKHMPSHNHCPDDDFTRLLMHDGHYTKEDNTDDRHTSRIVTA
ncbi:MAG: tail fiber protein [Moorea sp. SIO2I5]|nr:tail fiber protein [Moorena sp. SIO2I5]